MIVDASDDCVTANFNLGAQNGGTARSWNIKVTQYNCGQEDIAGPDGCLQYFTGASGTISSFNFPIGSAVQTQSKTLVYYYSNLKCLNGTLLATHLSSQCYEICIRRDPGMCAICYIPAMVPAAGAGSPTFGLS